MRTTFACLFLFLFTLSPGLVADQGLITRPANGEKTPLHEPPTEIVIFESVSEVTVFDQRGREVPGSLEIRGPTERVFVPREGHFPEGQYSYTIDVDDVVRTFTVGPDRYGPTAIGLSPEVVERDTTITLTLTEPIDAATVTGETVYVAQQNSDGTQEPVSGTISVSETGTEITFTPDSWPGFTPESEFEFHMSTEVTDLSGNSVTTQPARIVTNGETVDLSLPRVPECIFWSSVTEIGVLNLAAENEGTFDVADVVKPGEQQLESWLTTFNAGDPDELVVGPNVDPRGNGWIYGVDPIEERIVAFSTETGAIYERDVPKPGGIAIDPDGDHLYVANGSRHPDISTYELNDWWMHCIGPEGCLLLPFRSDGNIRLRLEGKTPRPGALAASPTGGKTAVIIPRKRSVILHVPGWSQRTLKTDRKPQDLAFIERGDGRDLLLVTCRGRGNRRGTIMVYDGLTGVLQGRLSGLRRPTRIISRGDRAWVCEERGNRVTEILASEEGLPTIGRRIDAGPRPIDVAEAADDSKRLFVVNRRHDRITVVNYETGQIETEVHAPGAIAVTSWGEN